ncbi:MAG: hypothetical protein ACR2FN_13100 [Chitinophagaceae bacterium]
MKKFDTRNIAILFTSFLIIYTANAQTLQTVTQNGRTTNQWIQITGSSGILTTGSGLELFGQNGDGYVQAYDRVNGVTKNLRIQTLGGNTYLNETGGNVGIGTTSPSTKLSIYKSTSATSYGSYPSIEVNNPNTSGDAYSAILMRSGNVSIPGATGLIGGLLGYALNNSGQLLWLRTYSSSYPIYIGYNQSDLVIKSGNVLIGKTSQVNTTYKLDVNGSVRANKIVVNTTGADFVFESGYKLSSLQSVELFIDKYKHLPGIASAKQMQNDGLNVGEMNTKLLQKVEELTLYVIQLQKENDEIKEELKKLSHK